MKKTTVKKNFFVKEQLEIAKEWIEKFDSYWLSIIDRTEPCPQIVYDELKKWQELALNNCSIGKSDEENLKVAIEFIKNFPIYWTTIVVKTLFGSPGITKEIETWRTQALFEIDKYKNRY